MAAMNATFSVVVSGGVIPVSDGNSTTWTLKAVCPTPIEVLPGQSAVVGTGIALTIDAGYLGVLAPQSLGGLTITSPSIVVSSADEIKLVVLNSGTDRAFIYTGTPIAKIWFPAFNTCTIT